MRILTILFCLVLVTGCSIFQRNPPLPIEVPKKTYIPVTEQCPSLTPISYGSLEIDSLTEEDRDDFARIARSYVISVQQLKSAIEEANKVIESCVISPSE